MSSPLADIEKWEEFLESNYHQFSRRIRVENLVDRLRSDLVLTQDDQDMVLNRYCTQFLKAGQLIDIVKTKGRNGFLKFMEAVECEYPDVYFETTGKEARPNKVSNSKRQTQTGVTTSIIVLDKMGDLISAFTKEINEKKLELRDFRDLVAQLKADLEKQSEEQTFMVEQLRQFQELNQQLRLENKDLSESLAKEVCAREEIQKNFDTFRSTKLNEFYNRIHQPVTRCLTLNPFQEDADSCDQATHAAPSPGGGGKVKTLAKAYNTQVGALHTNQENNPNSGFNSKVLEENLCRLQESNDRLQCFIEEFKKETEQCRAKQLEAEASLREATNDNKKLKAEMCKMEDQCKLMADMMRQLKNEIDTRQSKTAPGKVLWPRMCPDSNNQDADNSSNTQRTLQSPTGKEKRPEFENTASATSTLLQSSLDLMFNPLQSIDK